MYLITGATGNVGSEVLRTLVGTGEPVRALTRDPANARFPTQIQVGVGDLNRPETLTEALQDVSGVFLLPGYDDMPGLLNAIQDAGVRRVVLLSGSSAASGDMTNAITAYMVRSEQAVTASGIPATILRPSEFMSNALRWAPQLAAGDVIRAPFANASAAVLDPADIAAVAAVALTTPGHEPNTYRITGPEALTPADRVAILANVLDRDLRFEAVPDDEARQEMAASMPTQYVDAFFDFFVDGALDESEILPTVQQITGRRPRTFEEWATTHADAFT